MSVLKSDCLWEAVIYEILRSVVASLLTLSIKGTTVQILCTFLGRSVLSVSYSKFCGPYSK